MKTKLTTAIKIFINVFFTSPKFVFYIVFRGSKSEVLQRKKLLWINVSDLSMFQKWMEGSKKTHRKSSQDESDPRLEKDWGEKVEITKQLSWMGRQDQRTEISDELVSSKEQQGDGELACPCQIFGQLLAILEILEKLLPTFFTNCYREILRNT